MKRLILLTIVLCWARWGLAQEAVPIANDIGQLTWAADDIKSVMIGERSTWDNDIAVTIVLPASDSQSFEKTAFWAFETDGFEYQKHWLSLVFQGRTNPPVFVQDETEVVNYVLAHRGAIGILHDIEAPADMTLRLQ